MNAKLQLHEVVALLEDMPAKHFETDQPLLLRRGQIGTVVMAYDGSAVEVAAKVGWRFAATQPAPATARLGCLRQPNLLVRGNGILQVEMHLEHEIARLLAGPDGFLGVVVCGGAWARGACPPYGCLMP